MCSIIYEEKEQNNNLTKQYKVIGLIKTNRQYYQIILSVRLTE